MPSQGKPLPSEPKRGWGSLAGLKLFPLGAEIRLSTRATFKADVTAGMAVALLALPLAITFAAKAGLPLWSGILSAAVAALIAPMLAGSPLLSAGPTNASAALLVGAFAAVGASTPEQRTQFLPALLLMTAGFVLLAAWLRLGRFADFVPRTVIAAVIAAAALRVLMLQLPVALGLPDVPMGTPLEQLQGLWQGLPGIINPDLAVALATLIIFALARARLDTGPAILIAVATGTFFGILAENVALAAGFNAKGNLFRTVGEAAISPSLATPLLGFREFSQLFSPALALAMLIIIEATANARASALRLGRAADLRQELFGIGMANLACAVGSAMPASGSVSRSALNIQAGARTGLASIATGLLLLVLAFLAAGLIAKIPLAALAVVVIAVERELINLPVIRLILRSGQEDRLVFLTTFATALLAPLDIAIYLGTGIAVAHYLHKTSQPKVVEYFFSPNGEVSQREAGATRLSISILHVAGSLHFGAIHAFHEHLRRAAGEVSTRVLILKFREAEHLDADGALLLRDLGETLQRGGRHLILCELNPATLLALEAAGLHELLGKSHLIADDPTNATESLAAAIRLARDLTGETEPILHVLTTPSLNRPTAAASGRDDWQI